ncbi:MAG: DnaJ domain-containing protein [Deltaproteobacteria bacterium]|nr:DnaJ domain-containing protein [Deltaproteobacteria bacterium]
MDLQRALEILEIDENATSSEIKHKYRDLASIWHPDRHPENPQLQSAALEKMKELNAAYDYICSYLNSKKYFNRETESRSEGGNWTIISCSACGVKNRIKANHRAGTLKCGKCGASLFDFKDSDNSEQPEERILCGDDNCIGIIGVHGRCIYCGKTYEEAKKEYTSREESRQEALRRQFKKIKARQKWQYGFYLFLIAGVAVFFFVIATISPNNSVLQNGSRQKVVSPKKAKTIRPREETVKSSIDNITNSERILVKGLAAYDTSLIKKLLNNSSINRHDIKTVQKNLSILGYNSGQADGIIGPKTLSAVAQFSNDFRIEPSSKYCSDLLYHTNFHATIAVIHADWCTLIKGDELKVWVKNQPIETKKEIEKHITNTKDPWKIIVLLNLYKFDKKAPPPLPLPTNGIMKLSFVKGVAPLKIVTKHKDQHHLIKLINITQKTESLTAFIRGGTSLYLEVPLGRYEIKSAVGKTWYGGLTKPFVLRLLGAR